MRIPFRCKFSPRRLNRRSITRQHLKFQAGNYHQFELNRLADALNAESAIVRQMNKWADRLVSDAEELKAPTRCATSLTAGRTTPAIAGLERNSYQLKAIKPVIQEVDKAFVDWPGG